MWTETKKWCTCGQGIRLPSHQIRHCDGNTAFPRSFSLSCDGHQRCDFHCRLVWQLKLSPAPLFGLPQSLWSCSCQSHVSVMWRQRNTANYLTPCHTIHLVMLITYLSFWVEDKFSYAFTACNETQLLFSCFHFFCIVLLPPQTRTSKKQRSRTSTAEREEIWAASTQSCRMCRGSW